MKCARAESESVAERMEYELANPVPVILLVAPIREQKVPRILFPLL
jgi:hypothetical protein